MPNTLDNISEARELVSQLIDKTLAKKLEWTQGDNATSGELSLFEAGVGTEFTIKVFSLSRYPTGEGYGIEMIEGSGAQVLRVELESSPRYGYSLPGELELAQELTRLHELARRSVFGVDSKVSKAKSLLLSL
jgi:hypothetical protein